MYEHELLHELLERYEAGERDFSGLELEECHLSDSILIGINLSNADFQIASFMGTHLDQANLSCANLPDADLWTTYAIDANLSYTNLTGAELSYANLTGANLTEANLTGANLTGTILIGANLTNANLNDVITTEETIVYYTTRPDGNLIINSSRGLDAKKLLSHYAAGRRNFEKVILHQVDLSGVELLDVDMHWAHFSNCNLSHATLSGDWYGVHFINCDLRGARLDCCYLKGARFLYTDMRGATIHADTTCTSFIEVNFQDAKLKISGESLPFFHDVTLKDGFFLQGSSNYPVRPNKNIEKLL